jgi:hypothetical protein
VTFSLDNNTIESGDVDVKQLCHQLTVKGKCHHEGRGDIEEERIWWWHSGFGLRPSAYGWGGAKPTYTPSLKNPGNRTDSGGLAFFTGLFTVKETVGMLELRDRFLGGYLRGSGYLTL